MTRPGRKLDLIQELTTHKNDYKPWPLPKHETSFTVTPDTGSQTRKPTKIPQIDYQSHQQYMTDVPFSLYLEPKPIVGTDPRKSMACTEKSHFTVAKDHLVLKSPGKPAIDVVDGGVIRTLLLNTYVPVHKGVYEDACLKVPKRAIQAQSVLINDNVDYRPDLYPPLPPGWVEAAKHWDCLQSRTLGDPTKTFWLKRGPEVECASRSDYRDILPEEMKREIRTLIEEDRLRLPFSITKTGYGGYRQTSAMGVPLGRHKNIDF